MSNFYENFRAGLIRIRLYTSEYNYHGCGMIARDLTTTSLFMNDMDSLFISEYFEWIFKNLEDLNMRFKLNDEKYKEVNTAIEQLIDYLSKEIPIKTRTRIYLMYQLMKICRFETTRLQETSLVENEGKFIRRSLMREFIPNE